MIFFFLGGGVRVMGDRITGLFLCKIFFIICLYISICANYQGQQNVQSFTWKTYCKESSNIGREEIYKESLTGHCPGKA